MLLLAASCGVLSLLVFLTVDTFSSGKTSATENFRLDAIAATISESYELILDTRGAMAEVMTNSEASTPGADVRVESVRSEASATPSDLNLH